VPPPPPTPRETRARTSVEALLVAGIALSLVLVAVERASPEWQRASHLGPPWTSIPIDVARDPPWLLRLLPGIGPARAEAIVAERLRRGPPTSLRDLEHARGVGHKTVEALEAAGARVAPVDRTAPDPNARPP
jgi:hypothetical protein